MSIVSVVVPVFRNAFTLFELYSGLRAVFNEHPDLKLELVFVNDGSDDESLEIIKRLNAKDSRVQYLSFDKNYGQVPAIVAGLKSCSGDLAVVMSADLQDPLEMIQEILNSWEAGYEVIICYRTSRDDRWINRFFSALFYRSMRLIYSEIPLGGFDFFGLDRKAIDEFNCIANGGKFLQGDVIQLKAGKSFLPYERRARKNGKSQWTMLMKFKYAFYALASGMQLKVFWLIGIVFIAMISVFCVATNSPKACLTIPFLLLMLVVASAIKKKQVAAYKISEQSFVVKN